MEADDIDKPNEAYSIEDAKLKTEEDARQALAEVNKAKQREKIAELRSRYMLLVEVSALVIYSLCHLILRPNLLNAHNIL